MYNLPSLCDAEPRGVWNIFTPKSPIPVKLSNHSPNSLSFFQEELLTRIAHKLNVLRAEQLSLKEEVEANEELGAGVRDVVHRTAKVFNTGQ